MLAKFKQFSLFFCGAGWEVGVSQEEPRIIQGEKPKTVIDVVQYQYHIHILKKCSEGHWLRTYKT